MRGLTYFSARDTTHGFELWRTDGTPEGTFLVKDLLPGLDDGHPSRLTELNGWLLFTAQEGVSGSRREPWRSDGTSEGTVRVVSSEWNRSVVSDFVVLGGHAYFMAQEPAGGMRLWRTDGTAGPELVPGAPRASTASGSTFPLGTTEVSLEAGDAAGNTSRCTFPVVVADTTAPMLTCPEDVHAVASSRDDVAVTLPPANATDAVTREPTLTLSHESGGVFAPGSTPVVVTATDAAGNASTCTFTVRVERGAGGCGAAPGGSGSAGGLAVALLALARWLHGLGRAPHPGRTGPCALQGGNIQV